MMEVQYQSPDLSLLERMHENAYYYGWYYHSLQNYFGELEIARAPDLKGWVDALIEIAFDEWKPTRLKASLNDCI